MPRFIDLDEIAPEPVTVRIAGDRYTLPGDVPVPEYFELNRLAVALIEGDDDAGTAIQDLDARLLALFQIHHPDLERLPIGPRLLLPLVFRYLNGGEDEAEPEEDAAPPRRAASTKTKPTGGRRTTPTTRRTKTASGSST